MKAIKMYSRADLENARNRGGREAVDLMLRLMIWGLMDVADMPDKDIQSIIDFVTEKAQFVISGEVSSEDIRKMIERERQLNVIEFTGKGS